MLALLILFQFGGADAGAKIQLAVALFVLPSIPLSPIGGEIADGHDKAAIARSLKFAEIFVQAIAAAGFLLGSLALLYVALTGLGIIAALFGPIKYGILPDHLRKDELVAGNALIEGATFAAIIARPRVRRLRGGGRALAGLGCRAARRGRARLLRDLALHPRDRGWRAGPAHQLEPLQRDARHPA